MCCFLPSIRDHKASGLQSQSHNRKTEKLVVCTKSPLSNGITFEVSEEFYVQGRYIICVPLKLDSPYAAGNFRIGECKAFFFSLLPTLKSLQVLLPIHPQTLSTAPVPSSCALGGLELSRVFTMASTDLCTRAKSQTPTTLHTYDYTVTYYLSTYLALAYHQSGCEAAVPSTRREDTICGGGICSQLHPTVVNRILASLSSKVSLQGAGDPKGVKSVPAEGKGA